MTDKSEQPQKGQHSAQRENKSSENDRKPEVLLRDPCNPSPRLNIDLSCNKEVFQLAQAEYEEANVGWAKVFKKRQDPK
ncbi:uncharacterized protein E0L32_002098 [Thyridium curvatum]|uniref:Uncharacterized protein n=1 Tax=Thyridium curvatum TaxID=1093900 RepID=A0A507AFL5_9PEZI|nr:uncharacterized protein E0L32_002035 [Thyridium curvatum]XP_030989206.1 uncharacterized protein E0L32_002098 [Thyridium curvatum]TPX07432.1 hypothetical protein E0L32_002035 [Thyridium curvatum]TPX07495.1 hypothetical protein E0L32_002098 [Thyridium curvatum]